MGERDEARAQRFRALRKKLGLTQAQFAERLGITGNTVARYERGELGIPEPTLRLARILAAQK